MFEPAEGDISSLGSESQEFEGPDRENQPKEEIQSIPKAESPVPTTSLNKEISEQNTFSKNPEEEVPQAGEQIQQEQLQPERETPKEITNETPVVLTPVGVEASAEVNTLTSTALEIVRKRNKARERLVRGPIGKIGRKAA